MMEKEHYWICTCGATEFGKGAACGSLESLRAKGPVKCACGLMSTEHETQDHIFVLPDGPEYVWLCSDHEEGKHGLGCHRALKSETQTSEDQERRK